MATPACVPNIGPRGIRRRRVIGLACLALALWSGSRLAAADALPQQYLSLAPLLFGAALGWFQAKEKT